MLEMMLKSLGITAETITKYVAEFRQFADNYAATQSRIEARLERIEISLRKENHHV
jgi:hypothetical protein